VASKAADADTVNRIRAIVALRSASSVPTLCALTAHPCHLVRVEALQALAALDPEGARASLQRATCDEHPDVRFVSEKFIAALAA
jgi:HEAT repeat protein